MLELYEITMHEGASAYTYKIIYELTMTSTIITKLSYL